jgi:hypothetical protein
MNVHQLLQIDEARFYVRRTLERAGCYVQGYDRNQFQVALKRGCLGALCVAALNLNARVSHSLYYFPLGSDAPPAEFLHWCPPYTPERGFPDPGFWLYANVEIRGDVPLEISI